MARCAGIVAPEMLKQFLNRAVIGLSGVFAVIAGFYLVTRSQGIAAWERYEHEARARGVKLDLKELLPPPVPDEENFFMAPIFGARGTGKSSFVRRQYAGSLYIDLLDPATQREYLRIVRLAGGQVPDFARYDLALKELKRQDCEREDECLTQLAQKAEALYAMFVGIDYTIEGAGIAATGIAPGAI